MPRGMRLIVESLVVIILVERKNLLINVSDEKIHPSVLVEVRGIHSHAGARMALGAVTHTRREPGFLKAAIAAIHEEKIRYGIVGDEEIHAAVIVDVGRDHAPGFAKRRGDA